MGNIFSFFHRSRSKIGLEPPNQPTSDPKHQQGSKYNTNKATTADPQPPKRCPLCFTEIPHNQTLSKKCIADVQKNQANFINDVITELWYARDAGTFSATTLAILPHLTMLKDRKVKCRTPLHFAVRSAQTLPLAKQLVAAGHRGDQKDANGWTPLMHASMCGCTAAVRWLMEQVPQARASLHVKSSHTFEEHFGGSTALHICAKRGHGECYAVLVKCGAREGWKDSKGQTPALLKGSGGVEKLSGVV